MKLGRRRVLAAALGSVSLVLICVDLQLKVGENIDVLEQPLTRSEPGYVTCFTLVASSLRIQHPIRGCARLVPV